MEQLLLDLLKLAPEWGGFLVLVWMGSRVYERVTAECNATVRELSKGFQESVREIGEKCHDAHHQVATLYHEQSTAHSKAASGLQSQIAQLSVHIAHFAEMMRDRDR